MGEKQVPQDDEQKAADEGRVTEAQQSANDDMARQIAEREQQQVDDRLDQIGGKR